MADETRSDEQAMTAQTQRSVPPDATRSPSPTGAAATIERTRREVPPWHRLRSAVDTLSLLLLIGAVASLVAGEQLPPVWLRLPGASPAPGHLRRGAVRQRLYRGPAGDAAR